VGGDVQEIPVVDFQMKILALLQEKRMAMERLADTSTPGIHLEGGVRERSEIAYLQPSAAATAEWNHFNETKTIKKYYSRYSSR